MKSHLVFSIEVVLECVLAVRGLMAAALCRLPIYWILVQLGFNFVTIDFELNVIALLFLPLYSLWGSSLNLIQMGSLKEHLSLVQ